MTKRIISSSVPSINVYEYTRNNDAVNLDNVETMSIGKGTKHYNTCFDITFNLVSGEKEIWLYRTEKSRDKDWDTINQNFINDLGEY